MRDRALIVSASMGAGHDAVAAELARRLAAVGARVEVVDVLALLPLRLGVLLRWWYRGVMLRAPWLYALVYRVFFVSRRAPSTSPLTVVAAAGLARVVRRVRPSLVVPVFHVAAQAAGHLRARGRLAVPSVVVLTDFAVHRLWLHPGNDRYLCPDTATALAVTAAVAARPSAAPRSSVPGSRLRRPALVRTSGPGSVCGRATGSCSSARGPGGSAGSRRPPSSWPVRAGTRPSCCAGATSGCAAAWGACSAGPERGQHSAGGTTWRTCSPPPTRWSTTRAG